jgi:hypothetical protein
MSRFPNSCAPRSRRRAVMLALLALAAGWLLLVAGVDRRTDVGTVGAATAGRQLFLPLLAAGGDGAPPSVAGSELSFSLALSPAKQVAPGELLRATVTAFNGGTQALTFRDLTLRFSFEQLAFEQVEGEGVLVVNQSGDSTTATFRRIEPGATVSGVLLFRVRAELAAGSSIVVTPEYFCGSQICTGNLAQVQVGGDDGGLEGADDTQELLAVPASGGLDTLFRFSSRKFADRDTVELWLSSEREGVRPLPQSYRVDPDGWVRFELKGAEFGPGDWSLLAHGSISGFTSIANFTVGEEAAPAGAASTAALDPPLGPSAFTRHTRGTAALPVQETRTGGLAGRVADSVTGAGLADLLVVVLREGRPVVSVRTGADGRYLVPTGLATGSYSVRVLAASAGGAPAYQDGAAPRDMTVTAPDLTTGVDIGLARGGTVAGRVTAADTRRSLGGVTVEMLDATEAVVGAGATAADGSYAIEGLPEGSYSVRFRTATGEDGDVAAYSGTTVRGVVVTAGTRVFTDVGLSLRPTIAKIRGRVSGASGGLPDVIVAVFDAEAELVELTRTGPDGHYATGPLANGAYRIAFITFFADSRATRAHTSAYYPSSPTLAAATPVVISSPGAVERIDATLSMGGAVSGIVRSVDGVGLADVLVAAFDTAGVARAVGRSDAAGAYELTGLAGGPYRFGYFPRYAASAEVRRFQRSFFSGKADLASADVVAVAVGQTVAGIDVRLSPGGAIAGTVAADGGPGLRGVVVIAFDDTGRVAAAARTDEAGAYELAGLPSGPYTVLFDTILSPVEASRGFLDEQYNNRREPPYTPVVVVSGTTTTANASLARGGQIAGRVTAADSGLGLSGVAVLVLSGDTVVSFAMTDASGAYSTAGLPAGAYTLRFDPSRSADQETERYRPQTSAAAVQVVAGAVNQGGDAALARR